MKRLILALILFSTSLQAEGIPVAAISVVGTVLTGVRAEICEQGLADKDTWPEVSPAATEEFSLPAFALDTLPGKYVEDGVRGARPSPSLLRMTATVAVPAGRHRVLVRSRSAARVMVDQKLLVETPFAPKNGGDGSQSDTERLTPLDLGAGYRFAPRGEYERIAEWDTPGGNLTITLEAFVGGREGQAARRVELGETVVAVSWAGSSEWRLLTADGNALPYTDDNWRAYREEIDAMLQVRNAAERKRLRKDRDEYWTQRRNAAADWLRQTPDEPVPPLPHGFRANNEIDHFVATRFAAVRAQYSESVVKAGSAGDTLVVDFFRDVKPLLDSRCVDCHSGPDAKGGLRMHDRAALLKGGDSGTVVVPGDSSASELIRRIASHDEADRMPPHGARLSENEVSLLSRWIAQSVVWPELPLVRSGFTPPTDDTSFLRRVMLDTVGVPPTADAVRAFVTDPLPSKRSAVVDRLLEDDRWADHWMPLWQDLLAENPNILNPTLNNTGPFRWWLYESLRDDLPLDRLLTQLIEQQGDAASGGPAGFGLASQNDSPFAAKGTILSAALLGIETKCARCHDSPTGSTKQEQLFQLGAMLAAKPLEVPKTSSVDPVKLHAGGRKALIEVTLSPGSKVAPAWPFGSVIDPSIVAATDDPRPRLAELLTSPQNERFAQVMSNRVWARFMGRGLVEPMDDWERGRPTHPELLRWLSREFVRGGYQVKSLARLILNSDAYQRSVDFKLMSPDPLYAAPEPRRLLAEQIVDSLVLSTGKPLRLEPLCLDLNGRRDTKNSVDLGVPRRAWMLASLSNERDRPSLSIPRLQAVSDVMTAFGWRGARQDPASTRDHSPNAMQPAILANGVLGGWLTRLSDDHPLTDLAVKSTSPESLVDELFLRLLSRSPSSEERNHYTDHLSSGFDSRLADMAALATPERTHAAPKFVTWTNHLQPESDVAKQELAADAKRGDPPSQRLASEWRTRCEDVIWTLLNSSEVLYRP